MLPITIASLADNELEATQPALWAIQYLCTPVRLLTLIRTKTREKHGITGRKIRPRIVSANENPVGLLYSIRIRIRILVALFNSLDSLDLQKVR